MILNKNVLEDLRYKAVDKGFQSLSYIYLFSYVKRLSVQIDQEFAYIKRL